ncbi:Bardet-Biedl syndrome 2 protein [Sarcoptes scabiei]|uniref:Bardet-Biedl syndrome 2 protein n=2 Tax=Sarcoptes scabiei TaxID=52283 RepID=A0A834VII7_SARSC|nr:Bardet-Biedl syndrome 2 protein [Sarcoptes scabiei]
MPLLTKEFTINLNETMKPGKVKIGYFDGNHPCIVAVSRSDKIFVHNPSQRLNLNSIQATNNNNNNVDSSVETLFHQNEASKELNFLNINQTINCIAVGSIASIDKRKKFNEYILEENSEERSKKDSRKNSNNQLDTRRRNDILIVGTNTSIQAYDVYQNTDLFYKEIPDGANTIVIGKFSTSGSRNDDLALIGGNCAIHGIDYDGEDVYWMVSGDNITAMDLIDIDNDDQNELVIGTEDSEIQVFKRDAIIMEINETDTIRYLCSLGPKLFAYALSNGTVGVYQGRERLWRIKSKNQITCLFGADINDDGHLELITGWNNGKLDIRIALTGEIIYKDNFKSSISGLMIADYNMDDQPELIVCTVAGDVHGFHFQNQTKTNQIDSRMMDNYNIEQETIRELMKRKQNLMQELRNYEENARLQNLADPMILNKGQFLTERGDHFGAIPADTRLKSSLIMQTEDKEKQNDTSQKNCIELRLETTNETKIRAALVFAEGIFNNESMVVFPKDDQISNVVSIPLWPPKDVAIDMHIKCLVGYQSGKHFHVFELSRRLPRFAMYLLIRMNYLNENETDKEEEIDEKIDPYLIEDYQDYQNFRNPNVSGIDPSDPNYYVRNDLYDEDYEDSSIEPKTSKADLSIEISQPNSYVILVLNETISKMAEWIEENFLLDLKMIENEKERRFEFISLRNQTGLIIELIRMESFRREKSKNFILNQAKSNSIEFEEKFDEDVSIESREDFFDDRSIEKMTSNSIVIKIFTSSIELAGNCVQSIGEHFKITNLNCYRAHFPEELEQLKQLTGKIDDIQNVRQQLMVEVADTASMIRAAVVRAEDARLTEQYEQMKMIYQDLFNLNKDIMREYQIRYQNHIDLVDNLKQINLIIQRASNLRIGSFKTTFIKLCRDQIKEKNFSQLFKIINEE